MEPEDSQGKVITIQDVQKNIKECESHTHATKVFEAESRCPFCGYMGTEWKVDNFGWAECPKCGAT